MLCVLGATHGDVAGPLGLVGDSERGPHLGEGELGSAEVGIVDCPSDVLDAEFSCCLCGHLGLLSRLEGDRNRPSLICQGVPTVPANPLPPLLLVRSTK